MKASIQGSGNQNRQNQGRRPYVTIVIEPEGEAEKAVMRMAYSGRRRVFVWDSGIMDLRITMPRGSNEDR